MSSISNKTNQDVYAAFNKLGTDAATNDAKMGTQVQADVATLSQTLMADTEMSTEDKTSLIQQVANLLPIAGEAGHGAEWNADMQKLVTQLSALQSSVTSSDSPDSTNANGTTDSSPTTNEQVADAYNALNTLAGANNPDNNSKIHDLAQSLLTTVQNDSSLTASQKSDFEGKVSNLLSIAGQSGHGTQWNSQMQALVGELSELLQSSGAAGSSSTGAADTTPDAGSTSIAASTDDPGSTSDTTPTVVATSTDKSTILADTTLFPSGNGPTLADIQQGGLNDCTVDAALSSMAQNDPSAIADMFTKKADGTYDVTLFPAGVKTTVNINPATELVSNGTKGANDQADWASMVEAAAVKVGFSLSNGNGAQPGDAMQLLTGTGGSYGLTSDFGGTANIESGLASELASGKIVMAGTTEQGNSVNGTSIDANHAYAVLSVKDGQVTVRNPWSNQANNGVITMSVADYAKAFLYTYMAD